MDLPRLQSFMLRQGIDTWLVHDFRGNNPAFARLIGGRRWTTRRAVLVLPARGAPWLICSRIDEGHLQDLPLDRRTYVGWREFQDLLGTAVTGRVAMEYAPGAALPAVSIVDAGTVELVRALGGEVVSSADLIQISAAAWSAGALREHERVSAVVASIKDEAFAFIRDRLRSGRTPSEHDVAELVRGRFAAEGLEHPDGPIVAVNEHAGDPHYEPGPEGASPIRAGDWVLLDLWARHPGEEHIFADITWVGYAGAEAPPEHRAVFDAVRRARDAALALAQRRWSEGREVQGWELDEAAREPMVAAGYAEGIRHRTGHSLSPGPLVHGLGMNLDNLETRDTRRMLAGTGFTIEPGIYTPRFGVRLEINVYVDEARGPRVTSCVQDEIVPLA
jgi:Xaa-Pro dipeptidase